MIKKLNLVRPAVFAALLCGAAAVSALAQDPAASPNPRPPSSPGPTAERHHGPPPMPLFDALDTNHDGIISAEEIANASASLKALLKNGSDHLTREDLRPAGAPPGSGPQAVDESAKPRPKIGAIRPHGPPPRPEEELAANSEEPRMHRPARDREQAREDFDRPLPWREEMREQMREHRRPLRMEDEAMDDAPPQPRHERIARREGPPRGDFDDQAADDVRPPRSDGMREEREARPHHAPPRPDVRGSDDDRPRPPQPMNEEAGPQAMHHGPPPMPLFDALDTNHDGTISAEEIANASASLKGLLKNGSDHLTRDDLRPAGPPRGERRKQLPVTP